MSIAWTDDLATGIEEIDEQHRELYRQVAALHAAMKLGAFGEVRPLLEFLARYALEHFAAEEDAMRAARYPGLDEHRRAHQQFVADFGEHVKRATERVSVGVVVDLSNWLATWLCDHVRRVDSEMARFLRAAREAREAHGAPGARRDPSASGPSPASPVPRPRR